MVHVGELENFELSTNQLKDVARIFLNSSKKIRGENVTPPRWVIFKNTFLGYLFPQMLREDKTQKFLNLD